MEDLRDLMRIKVYHDNTTDIYLIAARKYSFWSLYKEYNEYKLLKDEIDKELAQIDEEISSFNEDKQKKIREIGRPNEQ